MPGCSPKPRASRKRKLLAVEYKPKPVPRDVVRALPMPQCPSVQSALPAPLGDLVPAETKMPSLPSEVVKPLTPELRRLNVTVTADFIAELEQVRVAIATSPPPSSARGLEARQRALHLADGRRSDLRRDAPARVRP
jgi:hypothetical protein